MTSLGVFGTDHLHIVEIVQQLSAAGARVAAIGATEEAIGPWLASRYPDAQPARSLDDVLAAGVDLVATAAVPVDRASIAVAAMQGGADVVADKPGATTYEQIEALRDACSATGKRYTVVFSERLSSPAMAYAQELVESGRLGRIVHTVGLGPHTLSLDRRPDWFFDPARYGGILVDIGSHQVDQFLAFTGSRDADVVAASIRGHEQHEGVEVLGEMMLRSASATGYARVDYFTPAGLGAWGDVRFTVVGTDGYLEVRHVAQEVIVVDGERTETVACADRPVTWAARLLAGGLMDQDHVFTVTRICLDAQRRARHP